MFSTEFLDLPPLAGAQGRVVLPGSKSISNRVLLLSALCRGRTTLHDLLDSDDTRVMLAALRQLGCGVQQDGTTVVIDGIDGKLPATPLKFFMGNAGTAMRPLTAALAIAGGDFELSGVPRMHERPIGDLVDALRPLGCTIDYLGNEGYPPLRVGRPALKLDAPIRVRGDVSSQFLTALLIALPLVASKDIVVEVIGDLISKPYIEITLNLLARYGIQVRRDGWQRFTIPGGSRYQSPGTVHVEADASSASYFIALGAIAARTGAPVRIEGVGESSIQGDIRFVEAARLMGAQVSGGPNWLEITRGSWPLKSIDLDCNHIPDAAMTLAVMALYADAPTRLSGIATNTRRHVEAAGIVGPRLDRPLVGADHRHRAVAAIPRRLIPHRQHNGLQHVLGVGSRAEHLVGDGEEQAAVGDERVAAGRERHGAAVARGVHVLHPEGRRLEDPPVAGAGDRGSGGHAPRFHDRG